MRDDTEWRKVFPITPEEYWRRRDQDDKRWDAFNQRLDRLENALGTLVTIGKWVLGVVALTAATTIAETVARGLIHP